MWEGAGAPTHNLRCWGRGTMLRREEGKKSRVYWKISICCMSRDDHSGGGLSIFLECNPFLARMISMSFSSVGIIHKTDHPNPPPVHGRSFSSSVVGTTTILLNTNNLHLEIQPPPGMSGPPAHHPLSRLLHRALDAHIGPRVRARRRPAKIPQ